MDYAKLYAHRFKDVPEETKDGVWRELSRFIAVVAGHPAAVLDSSCGAGEFIRHVPAPERWAVDVMAPVSELDDVRFVRGFFQDADLPVGHFDMVFASNVLEHLASPEDVQRFLAKARSVLRADGRLVVMGPNFKHCAKTYFDCADHILALTDVSVEEHLAAAGFVVTRRNPKFMPYSHRSRIPKAPWLVRSYLGFPPAWRLLGRQFLIIAQPAAN